MAGGREKHPSKETIYNPVNFDDTHLVAAVEAAGLVYTLRGSRPSTVFAHTNEAFANLPLKPVETTK